MTPTEPDRRFLSRVPLLQDFTPGELDRILPFFESTLYEAGQVVIWEGRQHRSLYILGAGTAVVTKVVRGEVESVLARLQAGAHFGELSLIDDRAAAGSVTAESDCHVYAASYEGLQNLMRTDPGLYARLTWALLRDLAGKLRATNDKVQEAVEWGLDAASLDPA